MNPARAFFLTESVRHARALRHEEKMSFLCGLCQSTEGDPDFEPVRVIYRNMVKCDSQLELIASGQLRFDLADREHVTKTRKPRHK